MKKTRILVLGNDPQINQIEFDRLDQDIITFGVNRIWLKHLPNYLFFNDYDIIQELQKQPELLVELTNKSKIFSSDWLRHYAYKKKKTLPPWIQIHERRNKDKFPDSVTTGMHLFNNLFNSKNESTFYIAGVSLRWQNPSHFWKSLDHSSLNKNGHSWYEPRFKLIQDNFMWLKSLGFNMVSVNPDSTLNKMMRYENIGNLYSK